MKTNYDCEQCADMGARMGMGAPIVLCTCEAAGRLRRALADLAAWPGEKWEPAHRLAATEQPKGRLPISVDPVLPFGEDTSVGLVGDSRPPAPPESAPTREPLGLVDDLRDLVAEWRREAPCLGEYALTYRVLAGAVETVLARHAAKAAKETP